MKALFVLWMVFHLAAVQFAIAQAKPWLTDEKAREVAGAAIYAKYPAPCYSTYRNERLESFVLDVRKIRIVSDHLNNSVYFYSVASDVCDYVKTEKDGRQFLMSQASNDCCEYGTVAVDRATGKSYWFEGGQKAELFKEFVQDEQLEPDSSKPVLFAGLYLELVRGDRNAGEITSLGQLQDSVRSSFQSAYSPYERDDKWQRKFAAWWRAFRAQTPQLKLETTYEPTGTGTLVRGYSFSGFELTIPRSDPPPKGTATLVQWALLVKTDGTVEPQPSKVVFSSR